MPWYRRPAALVAAGALGVILLGALVFLVVKLATGSPAHGPATTTTPSTSTTTTAAPTTTTTTEPPRHHGGAVAERRRRPSPRRPRHRHRRRDSEHRHGHSQHGHTHHDHPAEHRHGFAQHRNQHGHADGDGPAAAGAIRGAVRAEPSSGQSSPAYTGGISLNIDHILHLGDRREFRWATTSASAEVIRLLCAPEGIRTPNLLIRSQKRRTFSLFQGVPRCVDNYVSPGQTVSRYPVLTQSVSRKLTIP